MKESDVVLVSIQQSDGFIKKRPAIVLREMPLYRDLLVCGISTKIYQYIDGFDEIIFPSDTDYLSSGLLHKSLIRLAFLMVTPQKDVFGKIGYISPERHRRLLKKLSEYLSSYNAGLV